jgi:hypothetical protein
MKRKISAITTFLTLSLVTQANARGVYQGPQLGSQKASDADGVKLLDSSVLRAKLSPALGLEASANYRQEEFGNRAINKRSWPVMVTGLVYPLPILNGVMGAGRYNTMFDFSGEVAAPSAEFFSVLDTRVEKERASVRWGTNEIPVKARLEMWRGAPPFPSARRPRIGLL